jgi:hypothetical protein
MPEPRVILYEDLSDSISASELAWAAGFLDGEGTLRFRGTKDPPRPGKSRSSGTFTIQASQIDRLVLDRLRAALGGGGKVYGPYTPRSSNRKPVFAYHIAGMAAVEAFDLLRPYLSPIKRQQGDESLQGYFKQLLRPRLMGLNKKVALRERRVAELVRQQAA